MIFCRHFLICFANSAFKTDEGIFGTMWASSPTSSQIAHTKNILQPIILHFEFSILHLITTLSTLIVRQIAAPTSSQIAYITNIFNFPLSIFHLITPHLPGGRLPPLRRNVQALFLLFFHIFKNIKTVQKFEKVFHMVIVKLFKYS